jgi:dUTP pyrophosphatase
MDVNFELRHPYAVLPQAANPGDAGLDLVVVERIKDNLDQHWFDTGVAVEIPEGYVGLIFPRSSISNKKLVLANSVGVIDSGYRGTIQVRFNKIHDRDDWNSGYRVGDKVAQLIIVPYPQINPVQVESLSDTRRGDSGFGSTGR